MKHIHNLLSSGPWATGQESEPKAVYGRVRSAAVNCGKCRAQNSWMCFGAL